MTRTQVNVGGIAKGLDRFVQRPWRIIASHRGIKAAVVGTGAVAVVVTTVVPVRDSVGTANIGLVLALIVGLTGYTAGIGPGLAVALAAAGGFTLLHAVPHGLPTIEDEQDAVTALLLLATGWAAGWLQRRRERMENRMQRSEYGYARLHALAEAAVDAPGGAALMERAADLVGEELGLRACFWETGPEPEPRRLLNHNGLIEGTTPDTEPARLGELLAESVAIPSTLAGRFVLVGRAGARPSRRQLRTAVIMADIAVAAASRPDRRP